MEVPLGDRLMSILLEQRSRLHEAIADVFVAPVGGFTFSGRVDRTPPSKIAAPRAFIGDSTGTRVSGNAGATYVVGFPVWVLYDGNVRAQVDGIDEIVARIHDAAATAGFDVVGHTPASLPPELAAIAPAHVRTSVVSIETSARGLTLCTPNP